MVRKIVKKIHQKFVKKIHQKFVKTSSKNSLKKSVKTIHQKRRQKNLLKNNSSKRSCQKNSFKIHQKKLLYKKKLVITFIKEPQSTSRYTVVEIISVIGRSAHPASGLRS